MPATLAELETRVIELESKLTNLLSAEDNISTLKDFAQTNEYTISKLYQVDNNIRIDVKSSGTPAGYIFVNGSGDAELSPILSPPEL